MEKIPLVDVQEVSDAFHIRPILRHINPTTHDEPPHRHNFQELIWIKSGSGRHQIDQAIIDIEPQTFYLISLGQVHHFLHGEDLEGYVINFTDDFLSTAWSGLGWDYRMTLLSHFAIHRSLTLDRETVATCENLLAQMEREFQRDHFGREMVLRHLLSLLLLLLERVRRAVGAGSAEISDNAQTYQQFLTHLERDYKTAHHVGHYARLQHITPRNLSTVIMDFTGKTAKKVITDRLLLEARRYLQHTNASVKEIAYALGYTDPSYFSKVFKQGMGVSPHAYKSEL